ncbi:uncharacterized protein LOC100679118 [Nasonia vitripennis]|uniref:Uncharacterized protein n=1 Tax=Nasonia vitripennis TaxID=7425 RepID=A0A7M7LKT6_NASVI|nr:uncharacterized protein LOC100679118 [Nasonia vitripennis]
MAEETDDLEQQCEDAVFQICCTRERYSVRCANQLEKYLNLKTKINTAPMQKPPVPDFKTPVLTEDQQELFNKFSKSNDSKVHQSNLKNDMRIISSRLKELKSIIHQIERSRKTDIHKLVEE